MALAEMVADLSQTNTDVGKYTNRDAVTLTIKL